jgi:hypothetical protein
LEDLGIYGRIRHTLKFIIMKFVMTVCERVCVCVFCSLFDDPLNIPDCTVSHDRIIVNNELEMTWKEAVIA